MTAQSKNKGSTDKAAMMEIYQKLGTPGEPHELLARMAGSWKTRTRSWMAPGTPPIDSEGSSEQKMILDGRFLYQEFTGDMMGAPFVGIGISGFDNHKQKFVSTWMDSMATGIFVFEGNADKDGRSIIQRCSTDDPIRGPITWQSVTRLVDDNTHQFEMYIIDQNGHEEKMMEISYIRR